MGDRSRVRNLKVNSQKIDSNSNYGCVWFSERMASFWQFMALFSLAFRETIHGLSSYDTPKLLV